MPFPDDILDSNPITSMTQTAQNVAEVYGLSREEMDQFAVDSHRKVAEAYDKGIYKDEIIPLGVEEPVFDDQGNWVPDEHGKTVDLRAGRVPAPRHEHRGPRAGSSRSKGIVEPRPARSCASRRATPARRTTASPPRC